MKGLNKLSLFLVVTVMLLPSTVMAEGFSFDGDECEVELNYDVQVSSADMVVSGEQRDLYRFEDGKLVIGEQNISLSAQQQQQLQQFQQKLHQSSGMLVELIEAALALAVDVVNDVLQHFELDSDATDQMFATVQQQIDATVAQQGDTYTFASDMFKEAESEMGNLLEQNLETVISDSMGQMLVVLGQAMLSGEGEFEERMSAFSDSVTQLEQKIEQKVERGSAEIERQGQQLCQQWQQLDEAEKQLHKQIPQLKPYQLVISSNSGMSFLR